MASSPDAPTRPFLRRRGAVSSIVLGLLGVALVGYALSDDPFLGGEPGFGRMQVILASLGGGLLLATCLPVRWRRRLAASAIMTSVSVAAVEIVLRPLLAPRFFTPVAFDDELIFKPSPGRTGEYRHDAVNGGGVVRYSINDDGYRGEPLRPPGEAWRVAVFGDSFIQAVYTREEATFCSRLEAEIAAVAGADCEVVNCGVAAYGPDQCLLKMRRELARLRPNLVVFAVFTGNDFGDLERNKMFTVGQDGRLQPRQWQLSDVHRSRLAVGYRQSVLLRALRRVSASSEQGVPSELLTRADGGAGLLQHLLANARAEHEDYLADSIVRNIAVDYFNADCCLTPDAESARHRRALMTQVLVEVKATAAAAGVPCIVLGIPYVLDVCPGESYRVDLQAHPDYRPDNLRRALESACTSASLPCFGLFDVLTDSEHFLRGWDDHWSEAGQAVAARALAVELKSRQWLPTRRN